MILIGDCLEVMKTLDANSVDSIVTDPPYGLSFMGKRWDYDVPSVDIWAECLRVLKPGGYLLAFAGTRTQHRMAVRIEDAGFEIRDMIAWTYGSGFPKSHNGEWGGTALKPALEPITMARKPLIGTVEANWREHGTGALNIDRCRIEGEPVRIENYASAGGQGCMSHGHGGGNGHAGQPREARVETAGRWPANLIHDGSDEVLAAFPDTGASPGTYKRGVPQGLGDSQIYGTAGLRDMYYGYGDAGSAARFFYCAKASKRDRDAGCEGIEERFGGALNMRNDAHAHANGNVPAARSNHHPTVKPTDLMRYLCRLVTPVGGKVMDPFMGSGSTGKAATLEGFDFIGIELDPEYALIAAARIEAAKAKPEPVEPQLGLFGEEQAA